ncbi:uncharacterized protein BJ212DRAFT_1412925 [Suillus subaureus]|uniref:Uncharacterized protein n=1 Tax=Suillus subaureus TaxID=48587 RepID=A0A9P7DHZ2_9AGAM|nr:uncharacterized protein BJ212DRAFT_1412925 [Suillus subaureus]KAG1794307.1 hypothetical protein BJ212DRAFT_1412925 [Suillus subaureus]
MPAVYAAIPVICYDIFLVVLAIAVLVKHLKERKELKIKPNAYIVMIVRYHVIYFVLNLATQIFLAIMWANLPVSSPVILERSTLMQACTDSGDVSRTVIQRYRAIYHRATCYHQHLGNACQRQLCACQYDIRGLHLLDFAPDV